MVQASITATTQAIGRQHQSCVPHWRYLLTCALYDDLLVRCGNRCEICEASAASQRWGKLCIDHDHAYGLWAVRGLLCQGCNRFIEHLPPNHPAVAGYLKAAWHLGKGWPLDVPAEPAVGFRVMDPRRRVWFRVEDGWARVNPLRHRFPARLVVPWVDVIHQVGAHNLLLLRPDDPAVRWRPLVLADRAR